jgi:dTDP-4-dehydrorhamnose reductase
MRQGWTLVVGASGQVGTQMLQVLGESAVATSRTPRPGWLTLDLAEVAEVEQVEALLADEGLAEGELAAIYCVGGMTYVDGCETQPELAWRTNARGPGVLAEFARRRGLPYVFFSTDYVFDGAAAVFDGAAVGLEDFEQYAGPYDEEARTHPLSVYGRTKLEGEQRVMQAHDGALVLRTTWVYGADPREKNYLYSLMRSLAAGTNMRTPVDQVSTPTYNRDLIAVALGLVEAGASGVFHVGGPEAMSRLAFARQVAVALGLDAELLEGVTTAELAQAAARPLASGLKTEKLRRVYPALKLRGVQESLDDCIDDLRGFLERLRAEVA